MLETWRETCRRRYNHGCERVYKSHRSRYAVFSYYGSLTIASAVAANSIPELVSMNCFFSALSLNSAVSLLSVNSFMSIGCVKAAFCTFSS